MRLSVHALGAFVIAASIAAIAFLAPRPASAFTLKTIYSFCPGGDCTNGGYPSAGVIRDSAGILYGTNTAGGANNGGNAFDLVPNAAGTRYTYGIVYSFCARSGCTDGATPDGGLIEDKSADFYGVTYSGGASGQGVAYELIPNARRTFWKLKILYAFCKLSGCTDGQEPRFALAYAGAANGAPYDGVSPLYGTAQGGAHGVGVVFQLTPGASAWRYKVIHHFSDAPDGALPSSGLTVDSQGNIFGTTAGGGTGAGTAFELTPDATGTNWSETALFDFKVGAAGYTPFGGLALDGSGDLFGTTVYGGIDNAVCGGNGNGNSCGVAFELAPVSGKYKEIVLHRFCARTGCVDGIESSSSFGAFSQYAAPVMGADGTIFDTTHFGGLHKAGTVFQIDASGFKALYDFCARGGSAGCTDGSDPSAVIVDSAGNLYGTTSGGGGTDTGTVFVLKP